MDNIDYEYKKAFTEVSFIINASVLEIKNKIPKKIIDFFEKNKLNNYNFEISKDSLKKQNLSDISKCILSILYMDYICDEKNKEELKELYIKNKKEYIEELKQQHFLVQENMFLNKNNEVKKIENNTQLIKTNKLKKWIYNIIRKIRGK